MPERRWKVPNIDPEPLYQLSEQRPPLLGYAGRAPLFVAQGEAVLLFVLEGSGHLDTGEQRLQMVPGTLLLKQGMADLRWLEQQTWGRVRFALLVVDGISSLRFVHSLISNFGSVHQLPVTSKPVRELLATISWALARKHRDLLDESLRVHDTISHIQEFLTDHRPSFHHLVLSEPDELWRFPLPLLQLTLSDWAVKLGYSRSALARNLRRRWGMAPGRAIQMARLRRAAHTLARSTASVGDIARDVGFSSGRSFILSFKRRYGATPQRWRSGKEAAEEARQTLSDRPIYREKHALIEGFRDSRVASRPVVRNWDGHYYRLFQCGLLHRPEYRVHDNSLNTMEYLGVWLLTLGGQGRFETGGSVHELEPGVVLNFNQPSFSRWQTPRDCKRWDRLAVYFTWEIAMGYFNHLQRRYGSVHRMRRDSVPALIAAEMVRRSRSRRVYSVQAWSRLGFRFLTEWHRWLQAQVASRNARPVTLFTESSLVSYQPRTIKNFAKRIGYSRPYLSKRLREQWDTSPGKVMRRVRMEEAAMILRGTNRRVAFIAQRVGFRSVAAFCRSFKRLYGQSPLRYRHQQR